jgi:hypothetical protein
MSARRDWGAIVDRLNISKSGTMKINMGSAGSAQVTRCRLLEQWKDLEVWTVGPILHLKVN